MKNRTPKTPEKLTPEERAAVGKGRAELERGEFIPLEELFTIVRAKRKSPRKKRPDL